MRTVRIRLQNWKADVHKKIEITKISITFLNNSTSKTWIEKYIHNIKTELITEGHKLTLYTKCPRQSK